MYDYFLFNSFIILYFICFICSTQSVLEYDLRPEQLSMVTTSQFFEQIIGILLSTAFPFIAAQMAMTVLVLLSYHSAAHQHMCKPQFVSGLIRSWGKAESTQNITDDERAHFK